MKNFYFNGGNKMKMQEIKGGVGAWQVRGELGRYWVLGGRFSGCHLLSVTGWGRPSPEDPDHSHSSTILHCTGGPD